MTATKSGEVGKDGTRQNAWITQIWWLSPFLRTEWSNGYLFFPPKDPALFEKAIRKFRPHLLVHE